MVFENVGYIESSLGGLSWIAIEGGAALRYAISNIASIQRIHIYALDTPNFSLFFSP